MLRYQREESLGLMRIFFVVENLLIKIIQKPDPPYAIPTVSDPVHDYMDLMPVPLPDQLAGRLGAGTSINLPLWIRGKVGAKNNRDVTNSYSGIVITII